MRSLVRIVLALVIAALPGVVAAAGSELTPHTARYKVKIGLLSGRLNTELQKTATGYIATHVIKPTGLSRLLTRGTLEVTSTFSATKDGLKPVALHEQDSIRNDPETRIRFDWSTNEARGTVGDKAVLLQLDGIAYDNVSIQYELMHDLQTGGPAEHYVLFDVEKLRIANVHDVGTRTVTTPAGRFEAIGIQHQKEGSSRVTTLWCAPELGYLPVIIEQHKNGKLKFRATLTRYTPTGNL